MTPCRNMRVLVSALAREARQEKQFQKNVDVSPIAASFTVGDTLTAACPSPKKILETAGLHRFVKASCTKRRRKKSSFCEQITKFICPP